MDSCIFGPSCIMTVCLAAEQFFNSGEPLFTVNRDNPGFSLQARKTRFDGLSTRTHWCANPV